MGSPLDDQQCGTAAVPRPTDPLGRSAIGWRLEEELQPTVEDLDRLVGRGAQLAVVSGRTRLSGSVVALVISREFGSRLLDGSVLGNLGNAYADLGEVEKAAALLQQAKAIGDQIGDPRIVEFATGVLETLSKPE